MFFTDIHSLFRNKKVKILPNYSPIWHKSAILKHYRNQFKSIKNTHSRWNCKYSFFGCGGKTRTYDLRVMSVLLLILPFILNYFKIVLSVTAVSIKLFYFSINYFVILALIYHFWDFRRFSAVKNYGRFCIHNVYILDTEKVSNCS